PNRHSLRVRSLIGNLNKWNIIFYDRMDLGDVNQRVSEYTRHVLVHFDDGPVAVPEYRGSIIIVSAQTEVTGSIHWRHCDDKRVYVNVFGQCARNVREIDW